MVSCLEYRSGSSIGDENFFTRPLVSIKLRNELPAEPHTSDITTNGSKNRVENIAGCREEVIDKIQKALKSLTLRDKCNLIQFWAPCSAGKYRLLKTVDQPFRLGKPEDGLYSYRRESERNWFLVDEKCEEEEEEELIPVARVFRRQLPEWTSDVTKYYPKKCPIQDCAIRLNLHGYLVLPVFDSYTMLCVGVLEFVTSLKHLDCAYEVQEVHRTLKAVNLTSPQSFDCPTSYVSFASYSSEIWQLSRNQHDLVNSDHKNWSSTITTTEEMAVADVIAEKTDVVTVENGYNSERKEAYTKRKRKRKMDSVTPQTIQQYFGKPIGEASTILGVSRSTLKRVCRELNIPRWPFPQRNKKYSHLSISVVICLLIRVKRWSCSISGHGFSAKWWICGKHNAFASKSNQTVIPLSKPQQACFGIYEAACLLLGLKRWRKRTVVKHATLCDDYLNDDGLSDINIFNVFRNKNVVKVLDTPKVTVKATYKDDIVKFDFTLSSGLSKLKNQVAQRIKELQAARFHLKYKDEDDDLILIACDDDLCNLMPFSSTSASKNTIKLIVEMANG